MVDQKWPGRLLTFSLFFALFEGAPVNAAKVPQYAFSKYLKSSQTIRVRLAKKKTLLKIRGLDLNVRAKQEAHVKSGLTTWQVSCLKKKITFSPVGNQSLQPMTFNGSVTLSSPAGFLTYDGSSYRNQIRIFAYRKSARCDIVNVIEIEKYLDSIVNSEFSSKWHRQSVAAQVIVARTYALFQIVEARKRKKHFDVEATIQDQFYGGTHREDFRASAVVKQTRGMVLTAKRSGSVWPMKAFYHSTCGGATELPQNVWGSQFHGFKKVVRCSFLPGLSFIFMGLGSWA